MGTGIALDSVLIVLLLISIVVNCTTLGTPLTAQKRHPERKVAYNELQES